MYEMQNKERRRVHVISWSDVVCYDPQPLDGKASFLKFINALYFLFYSRRVKKKRITHLSHGIFSFFCLYRREREN